MDSPKIFLDKFVLFLKKINWEKIYIGLAVLFATAFLLYSFNYFFPKNRILTQNSKAIQGKVILGQPVKWTYIIPASEAKKVGGKVLEIPKGASQVSISKAKDIASILNVGKKENSFVIKDREKLLASLISQRQEETKKPEFKFFASLSETRQNISELFLGFLAHPIATLRGSQVVNLKEDINNAKGNDKYIVVEYYTEAPKSKEKNLLRGKEVQISASEDLGYKNITAFTNIAETYTLKEAKKIEVYWKEKKMFVKADAYDLNGNGLVDYIEWTVPHLSEQTYEIIYISEALRLNGQKALVADISENLKDLDEKWEKFGAGEFVKLTFKKVLQKKNDISIYARSGSPAKIEVYAESSIFPLATFYNIQKENKYTIYLNKLKSPTNTFYLKVLNNVQINQIVDPAGSCQGTWNGYCNIFNSYQSWCAMPSCTWPGSGDGVCDGSGGSPSTDCQVFSSDRDACIFAYNYGGMGCNWDGNAPVTTSSIGEGVNTSEDIRVTLSCDDPVGSSPDVASGCAGTYYCTDDTNSCTPTIVYNGPYLDFSSENSIYLRYFSVDTYGNQEATKSSFMRIDRSTPTIEFSSSGPENLSGVSNATPYVGISSSDLSGSTSVTIDSDNSLVGWWRFNTDGDLADHSGNGNQATLEGTGGVPTWVNSGKWGGAYSFDSYTYNHIRTPENRFPDGNEERTISVWVNPDLAKASGHGTIFLYGRGGNKYMLLYTNIYTTNLHLQVNLTGDTVDDYDLSTTLNQNTWNHVVITYKNRSIKTYLNGTIYSTVTSTNDLNTVLDGTMYIAYDGGGNYFGGKLDDFQIYNRELTPAEVASLYSGTSYPYSENRPALSEGTHTIIAYAQDPIGNMATASTAFTVDTTAPYVSYSGNTPADASTQESTSATIDATTSDNAYWDSVLNNFNSTLVGWYRFENGSTQTDSSPYGSSTLNDNGAGGQNLPYGGKMGGAYLFSGTNYFSFSNSYLATGDTPGSQFAWIKTTNAGNTQGLFDYGLMSSQQERAFYIAANGNLIFTGYNADCEIGGLPVLTDGLWHHVGYVYGAGGTGTLSAYVDGVEYACGSNIGTLNTAAGSGTIGLIQGSNYFIGRMDDIQFYNRALSATEVASLYNGNTSGPVAQWKLNGTGDDSSGNGYQLQIYNWGTDTGKYNTAVGFGGNSGSYATPGDSTMISDKASISMWVKKGQDGVYYNLADFRYNSTDQLVVYITNQNRYGVGFRGHLSFETSAAVSAGAGTWGHILVTYDGVNKDSSNSFKIYADGVVQPLYATTAGNSSNGNTNYLAKGATNLDYPFSGYLDDVRLYNREVQASELPSIMASENSGTQYSGTISGLSDGSHSFIVYAQDAAGNIGSESSRTFTVSPPATCTNVNDCSGHGTCTGVDTCTCYQDGTNGYWGDSACSTCSTDYYGADCLTYCDGNTCGMYGSCNGSGGCDCQSDYYGATCNTYCSSATTCSSHGTCDGNGNCSCTGDYYGASCDIFCSRTNSCSDHGNCTGDGMGCTCDLGWEGASCGTQSFNCTSYSDCNAPTNGTCIAQDTCSCNTYYYGNSCETYCEASTTCSGQGSCAADGSCACNSGRTGADCSQWDLSSSMTGAPANGAFVSSDPTGSMSITVYADNCFYSTDGSNYSSYTCGAMPFTVGDAGEKNWSIKGCSDGMQSTCGTPITTNFYYNPNPGGNMNGSGTAEMPYEITTCQQLQNIGFYTNAYFKLMQDINCVDFGGTPGFFPINTTDIEFNGNRKVISNLKIYRPDKDNVGLFGYIPSGNTTIRKLGMSSVNITGNTSVGALIGGSNGTSFIYDSFVTYSSSNQGNGITGNSSYVGGLVGYGTTNIYNSYVGADVSVGSNYYYAYTGGLVGYLTGGGITNSFSMASVTGQAYYGGAVAGTSGGGITSVYHTGYDNGLGTYEMSGNTLFYGDTHPVYTGWNRSTWSLTVNNFPAFATGTEFDCGNVNNCSSHGLCVDQDMCTCDTNYYGADCNMYCEASTTCSGQGSCDVNGACACSDYYFGENCGTYCEASTTCGGRGTCDPIGGCACSENYTGGSCESCATNYYPSDTCATYCEASTTCNSNGTCDASGICACDSSHYGADCSYYDYATPSIGFTGSTPENSSSQSSTSATISALSSDDNNDHTIVMNFDNSLVGWWRFNYGEELSDGSNSANSLTNNGSTWTGNGKWGGAYNFNGTYISSTSTDFPTGDNPGSQFAWIKTGSTGTMALFDYGLSSTNQERALYMNWGAEPNALFFTGYYNDCTAFDFSLLDNAWHHVGYVYRGSGSLSFYVDGVEYPCNLGEALGTVSSGASYIGLAQSASPFTGLMDDVQVYNRALSSGEVASIYNANVTQYANTFTDLSVASHTFTIYAQDKSGKIGSDGARTFSVIDEFTCTNVNDCSGHGTCTGQDICSCDSDETYGYWNGNTSCSACTGNYYGTNCLAYCEASTTCTGQGSCAVDGSCACSTGFAGPACDTCDTNYYPSNACSTYCEASTTCNGNGSCGADGACVCNPDWQGANCSNPYPAGCPDDCSGNGICSNGTCTCSANYYGANCNTYCEASTSCNGQGNCNQSGACECEGGYYGPGCNVFCDANQTCSGRGTCDVNGACVCSGNYGGADCASCASDYYGGACDVYCSGITSCNEHGSCDSDGACMCMVGYYSSNCASTDFSAPSVNAGADVSTGLAFNRTAIASDLGSGIDGYIWSQVSGPGGIIFSAPGSASTDISANATGTYVISVAVSDLAGNTATDEFTLTWDGTGPTIAEKTPVTTPTTDTTPDYTFTSTEIGIATYGGDCAPGGAVISVGDNTVTFGPLDVGTYSNCTIIVADAYGNESNVLNVSSFTIYPSGGGANQPGGTSVPTGLTSQSGLNSITTSWDAGSAGTTYYVENITKGTNSGWISTTSWNSADLNCNASYSFRIKAKLNDVESDFSGSIIGTTTSCSATGGGVGAGWSDAITDSATAPVQLITDTAKQIISAITPEKEPTIIAPPVEEVVTKETPKALDNNGGVVEVDIAPIGITPVLPLSLEMKELTDKFPTFTSILEGAGLTSDSQLGKFKISEVSLPTLSSVISIPESKSLLDMSLEEKAKIPTEIIFAKSGNDILDLGVQVEINDKGKVSQKLQATSGMPLQLIIKPTHPVKNIRGTLKFISKAPEPFALNAPEVNPALASLIMAEVNVAYAAEKSDKVLTVKDFEYFDPDKDGIYTANIDAPVVSGQYKISTVMNYKDPKYKAKEITMTTLIDPEGYVYQKMGDQEIRIKNAKVTLYWLNPGTGKFEIWKASDYKQQNPQFTDKTGAYSFLAPAGTYFIKIESALYNTYQTRIFVVEEGNGVHENIELMPRYWWMKTINWEFIILLVAVALFGASFIRNKYKKLKEAKSNNLAGVN